MVVTAINEFILLSIVGNAAARSNATERQIRRSQTHDSLLTTRKTTSECESQHRHKATLDQIAVVISSSISA
jgi:hypothetical protein